MRRDIFVVVFCSGLVGACGPARPCRKNQERVIHTHCSCSDENLHDPEHACCRRDGGVCADEELIPPPGSSNPPIGGPRFGVWDFAVHPGEIVNGNQLIPSQNATSPYVCQPMFAKWSYVNLMNGQIAGSDGLGLEPFFLFTGPGEGVEPEELVRAYVPFERIPLGGSVAKLVPILGQETETFYYAQIVGLPPYTPGNHYLPVEVYGESETWNDWAWEFCQ